MKPSIPKGTRDFGPEQVLRRNFITDTIKRVYQQFGYQPLETPAMENLSTLTGKYGEEGDQLLFRVMNQGQKVKKADIKALEEGRLGSFVSSLADRGLRYDLTIPFARYVAMNRGTLTFPFKRYQIQAVWRGDRPQKGRYREFYQCDADVVGSNSLINEAELIQIFDRVFADLGLEVTIKVNNRKILAGLAEIVGLSDRFIDITIAIDKLDKVGIEGVKKELQQRALAEEAIADIIDFLVVVDAGSIDEAILALEDRMCNSEIGQKGIDELKQLAGYLKKIDLTNKIELDVTLARGLNYYTGCIFEVVSNQVKMGSIGGGGRYDDLTGTFGLPNVSGVGISFGLDRIYDCMDELKAFDDISTSLTKALFVNFDDDSAAYAFELLQTLRKNNIAAEIYPDNAKLKKQMKYANAKNIPFVLFTGDTERTSNTVTVKDMNTGEQSTLAKAEIASFFT